ncbi:hypothetical protein EXIGLDRAFT_780819 [Exidia glandulosa HHB12029]|uniref:Uncharacterized protein n=1 Tax=Exidia glandulosa HHB12029 TaxID=1314781 RepID=A0A165BFY9_EXIGL|nr:hypothetical protein EXIGLDRAFT_780819 [Exidia glandulosa HHB12029]
MQTNDPNSVSPRSSAIANRPPTPAPFARPVTTASLLLKRGARGNDGTIGTWTAVLNELRELSARTNSLANIVVDTSNAVRDFKGNGEKYFYDAAQNMAANFATFEKRQTENWAQYRTVPHAITTLARGIIELKEAETRAAKQLSTIIDHSKFMLTSIETLAGNIAESGATVTSDEFFDECRHLFEERLEAYAQARSGGFPPGFRAPEAPRAPPPTPTPGVEEIRAGPIPALLLAAALHRSTDPRPRPVLHIATSAIRDTALDTVPEDENEGDGDEDTAMSSGSAGGSASTLDYA